PVARPMVRPHRIPSRSRRRVPLRRFGAQYSGWSWDVHSERRALPALPLYRDQGASVPGGELQSHESCQFWIASDECGRAERRDDQPSQERSGASAWVAAGVLTPPEFWASPKINASSANLPGPKTSTTSEANRNVYGAAA